jgi:hypothetical protein
MDLPKGFLSGYRASGERRTGCRVPVEMFLNQYVRDQPYRALATNVSEVGLFLRRLVEPVSLRSRVLGIEFELPATGEIIWAKCEPRFEASDDDFHFSGIHFLAMARKHERLLRDYVREKRRRQLELLWLRLQLRKPVRTAHPRPVQPQPLPEVIRAAA